MLAYKTLTEKIIGAVYEVHSLLGPGLLEKPYANALVLALQERELLIEHEKRFKVMFKEAVVGDYIADIVVENTVIVEVKAVKELDGSMAAQLINYLNISGAPVGLLINFRNPLATIKRYENRSLRST